MPFIDSLLQFGNQYFIETGTYQGDTVSIINSSNIFKEIYSIELSEIFYNNCVKKFEKNNNIKIFKGNSKYELYNIIKNIDTPITFWLDSHWSGVPDVGCDKEELCPVLYELEQIKSHPIKTHVIMIDDIRLMDGVHFKVLKEQIEQKIYEINKEYTLKYYDDYTAKNDILVAYIEKKCIHKYLTKCKTNKQPPGFGDFLRGTIALYYYSKIYNYKLYIDSNSHHIFNFLDHNDYLIKDESTYDVHEIIPGTMYDSYDDIDQDVKKMFELGNSFAILTNSFYRNNANVLSNFNKISDDCKLFLQSILKPNYELQIYLENIFKNKLNIDSNTLYNVIHCRFGDFYLKNKDAIDSIFNTVNNKFYNLLKGTKSVFILLSDSKRMSIELKKNHPSLLVWDNNKIHSGDLENNENIETIDCIRDTLTDFFIMSRSNIIYSLNDSGFSKSVSIIFDKKYILI